MTAGGPAAPGGSRRFAPRAVGLNEFASMLRDCGALFSAAPLRLPGLFLLVFLPIEVLAAWPYAGVALRFGVAAVAFCGYYAALAAVRAGRPPALADLLRPWQLPADKVVLLVASGLLPLVGGLLAWWGDLGWNAVDAFLGGQVPTTGYTLHQELEFAVTVNVVDAPLRFLQPLCVLYAWSATRSVAASLLCFAANWRWVLAMVVLSIAIAVGLDSVDTGSLAQILAALLVDVSVQMALGAFTLVLLQRSLG